MKTLLISEELVVRTKVHSRKIRVIIYEINKSNLQILSNDISDNKDIRDIYTTWDIKDKNVKWDIRHNSDLMWRSIRTIIKVTCYHLITTSIL